MEAMEAVSYTIMWLKPGVLKEEGGKADWNPLLPPPVLQIMEKKEKKICEIWQGTGPIVSCGQLETSQCLSKCQEEGG